MDITILEKHFEKIGGRVKFTKISKLREGNFSIDVKYDKHGEFFDIRFAKKQDIEFKSIDIRPKDRYLLLLARDGKEKHKFICGHDERHWFVAAIPGLNIKNIPEAMEALKPTPVRQRQLLVKVKETKRHRRKNKAYIRQGEWFFIPADINPPEILVFKNEPIRRGRGKPHLCEYLYREGGETVYVNFEYPNGISEKQYNELISKNPQAKSKGWRIMRRNASVYVKGKITHSDHSTIVLNTWHNVQMNLESEAPSMKNVVFLD
jgi:hypothetical protein